jgi:hypothetical protein
LAHLNGFRFERFTGGLAPISPANGLAITFTQRGGRDMAFDFVQQWPETQALPRLAVFPEADRIERIRVPLHTEAIKWRQTLLTIVHDSMQQIARSRSAERDEIWRLEARRRALNFAELGLSELSNSCTHITRGNRRGWNIAAIATLGGAYRLLAKCDGPKLVQCEHILRKFLTNLALAYTPVGGRIALDLDLCSIVLAPIKCRALVLCAGMLIQAMMREPLRTGLGGNLNVTLSASAAKQHRLSLHRLGRRDALAASPEFELASRLGGILHAELQCRAAYDDGVEILLDFPAESEMALSASP